MVYPLSNMALNPRTFIDYFPMWITIYRVCLRWPCFKLLACKIDGFYPERLKKDAKISLLSGVHAGVFLGLVPPYWLKSTKAHGFESPNLSQKRGNVLAFSYGKTTNKNKTVVIVVKPPDFA